MDILTDALSTTHLRNVCHGPVVLHAPWGIKREAIKERCIYLILTQGSCLLDVDGAGSFALAEGDVVFLTLERAHALRDGDTSAALSPDELRATLKESNDGFDHYGGSGERTVMVWGGFEFDERRSNPLFRSLPPVIHVKSSDAAAKWVESCVRYLTEELTTRRPGFELIANRLIDVLFVQAVRAVSLAAKLDGRQGWGCSLLDPNISRALAAIHAEPSRAWSVESLAREAGMSRSAFAARFIECVGSAPGAYLTSWRMQKAADTLRSSSATLAELAAQSGYASEAAFVRAFKRLFGTTPHAYRRSEQTKTRAAS